MLPLWVLMAVLVAALLGAHHANRPRLEWLLKPAAALTFVAAGIAAGGLSSTFGRVLVLGLVLAAAGDVLLIPKSKAAFLGGLVAFLLGHVAYAVAFALAGMRASAATITAVAGAVAATFVLRWLWPHVERPMRVPVVAYVLVITTMVALAAGAASEHRSWALLVGAVAFYLSDLSVARDRFVAPGFANRVWGLPLYFFAQLLLASQAGR